MIMELALEKCAGDITVVDGLRSELRQAEYVRTGASKTMKSLHLKQDDGFGHAIDVAPWERGMIPWPNRKFQTKTEFDRRVALFQAVAEAVFEAADELGSSFFLDRDGESDGPNVVKDLKEFESALRLLG